MNAVLARFSPVLLALVGCSSAANLDPFASSSASATTTGNYGTDGITTTTATATASDSASGETSTSGTDSATGPKFDLLVPDADGTGGTQCVSHTPCDTNTDDYFEAMGLNCPGELQVEASVDAHPDGLMVLSSLGADSTYDPREGESYVLMSTGILPDRLYTEPDGPGDSLGHCNMWFTPGDGMDTSTFPPPIAAQGVNGDCTQDPNLVGMGDCSNSIGAQFDQSGFKYDYQELRFKATVPAGAQTLRFNVAYLTTEWPIYENQPYNDMFVAWVESSTWTGNVSFDKMGNPLSLNAAFLEFKDQNGDLPQFDGTCLQYHAATSWLETTVPVTAGDDIEVVFAIFDLDDVNWDSMVLLDNVSWGCGDVPPGPDTKPEG